MPRGKKPDTIPSIEWKLHIEGILAAKVELLLTDPVRKKPKYGARSALVEQLLRVWVDEQIKKRGPVQLSDPGKDNNLWGNDPSGLSGPGEQK